MAQHFLETRRSATSTEPLIDLLACLEPKLWPKKKTFYAKIRKCIESPTGGISVSNNLPLEYDSELFEPLKDL